MDWSAVNDFKPAFEVTRVDSMQWNRTMLFQDGLIDIPEVAPEDAAPLPTDLVERVRLAVKQEVAYTEK